MADISAGGGAWRKSEFVLWTDIFVVVEAFLVWLGLIVLAVAVTVAALAAQGFTPDLVRPAMAGFMRTSAFHHAVSISLYLVFLYFFWRIARRVSTDALAARFRALPWPTVTIAALVGMALAVSVPLLSAYLANHHIIELVPTKSELKTVPHSPVEWVIALASVGLVAPLVEELYFRGIVLGWLMRKMPLAAAVLANAAIFGLVHFSFVDHAGLGGWYITGILALVGLVAGVLAVKTRSLWASFALHSAYNATLISLPLLRLLAH
jgi:membrane protease YdiL (CAAX protease family)